MVSLSGEPISTATWEEERQKYLHARGALNGEWEDHGFCSKQAANALIDLADRFWIENNVDVREKLATLTDDCWNVGQGKLGNPVHETMPETEKAEALQKSTKAMKAEVEEDRFAMFIPGLCRGHAEAEFAEIAQKYHFSPKQKRELIEDLRRCCREDV